MMNFSGPLEPSGSDWYIINGKTLSHWAFQKISIFPRFNMWIYIKRFFRRIDSASQIMLFITIWRFSVFENFPILPGISLVVNFFVRIETSNANRNVSSKRKLWDNFEVWKLPKFSKLYQSFHWKPLSKWMQGFQIYGQFLRDTGWVAKLYKSKASSKKWWISPVH